MYSSTVLSVLVLHITRAYTCLTPILQVNGYFRVALSSVNGYIRLGNGTGTAKYSSICMFNANFTS
jgi:hypothetical protein